MRRTHIRLIVVLGMIAIVGISIFQVVFMRITWNLNEKEFTQSVQIALKNVAEKIFEFNSVEAPISSPIVQLSSSYFVVNTNSEIDANILEYYLKNEFNQLNLDIDFEYAIYDCNTNNMVYGNYISQNGKEEITAPDNSLPTYDEYVYYFGVHFPKRRSYLIGELSIWTIFSGILILVIVFFSYALFIILQQKRLSELQKDFIDNMTHEFKTPISSVLISSDVLLTPDTWENKERIEVYSGIIKKETERLNKQIERVLQITRLEKKGFHLSKEIFDAHVLLKEIVNNFSPKTENKSVDFLFKLDAIQSKIRADKLHFTNIILNLIDNAVKYSNEELLIQIKTKNQDKHLLLEIRDDGIGIDSNHLKYIFQKFYRVPTSNIHNVKGFGLGLYYVKNICKRHKWRISVESELKKGTNFQILIPLSE